MRARGLARACALGLAALASSTVAEPLRFSISGSETASFVLQSSPTPDNMSAYGGFFAFNSVSGAYDGAPAVFDNLSFGEADVGGGFADDTYFDDSGAQLFTGSLADPTFVPGVYALTNDLNGDQDTLTISAVPEPDLWALSIAGGMLGGGALRAARRRRLLAALA